VTLLHAELRRLVTLPSLRLTALLTLVVAVLLTYVEAPQQVRYTQAGFLVLGVLATTSSYQGGDEIRVTLLAMPRRLRLYAAKLTTLAALTAPLACCAAYRVHNFGGTVAYLLLTTLLGAATGTLLRRAEAAAVLLLVGYQVICPLLRHDYLPNAPAWALGAVTLAAVAFHRRDA
jgi:hypothetical protein